MWNPTHVQLTVLRARSLLSKGRGGNNDVYVTIQLCKQKFQTSTIKNAQNPEWFEECELEIPSMQEFIDLTLYHRGVLQDDFLGHALINLSDYKVQERPKSQWLQLTSRPKKPDTKARGEIEIRLSFLVKSVEDAAAGNRKRVGSFKGNKPISVKSHATDSVLHPSDRNWRYSMPVIPTHTDSGSDSVEYSQKEVAPTIQHKSHTDLTAAQLTEDTEESLDRKRSLSMPLHKTGVGHQRQRIHMGSATLSKSEGRSTDVHGSPLRYITEEPSPHMAVPTSSTATSLEENLSIPCSENSLNSTAASSGSCQNDVAENQNEVILRNFHDSMQSVQRNSGSDVSHGKVAYDELSGGVDNRVDNAAAGSSSNSSNGDQQYVRMRRNPAGSLGKMQRRSSGHAQTLYNQQFDAHFNRDDVDRNSRGSTSDHNEHSNASGVENQGTQLGQNVNQNNIHIPVDSVASDHLKEIKVDDYISRRKGVAPPIPPPPLRPFSTSDSDDYAEESSSAQSRKTTLREEEPVRRCSKTHRNVLLSPQHRRYSIHGMGGQYKRPALYLYDDINTCHDEFRRTYLSDENDPQDLLSVYRSMTKEELIHLCLKSKAQLIRKDQYLHDLELYIDNLLVRVMETTPRILSRTLMSRC